MRRAVRGAGGLTEGKGLVYGYNGSCMSGIQDLSKSFIWQESDVLHSSGNRYIPL